MHKSTTTYHVLWDNGSAACGEFHYDFATREEADEFGQLWVEDSIVSWGLTPDDDDLPSYDIIELELLPSGPDTPHGVEGSIAEFDRYIG